MKYKIENIEQLSKYVESLLIKRSWPYKKIDELNYRLNLETTYILVSCKNWGRNVLLSISSPISVHSKNLNLNVLERIIELSSTIEMGKFSLDPENNIIFYEYSLLADNLDPDEFFVSLTTAGTISDKYDEVISQLTGGKRYIDLKR